MMKISTKLMLSDAGYKTTKLGLIKFLLANGKLTPIYSSQFTGTTFYKKYSINQLEVMSGLFEPMLKLNVKKLNKIK